MSTQEELYQVRYRIESKGDTVLEALRGYGPGVLKAHPDIAAALHHIEMLELAIKTRLGQLEENSDE